MDASLNFVGGIHFVFLDSFVVVVIYVAVNSLGKCFKRGILFFMPVEHLVFHPSKEGLHDAIVVTVALP